MIFLSIIGLAAYFVLPLLLIFYIVEKYNDRYNKSVDYFIVYLVSTIIQIALLAQITLG